jgi:UDP-glucose 4-epimerase
MKQVNNTPSSDIIAQHSSLSPQSSHKPTRWLVTGGCGFIGTSLIKTLIKEGGHAIRVVDNLSVGTRDDLARVCNFTELDPSAPDFDSSLLTPNSSPQLIVGDILYERLALKAAQGMDVIVHLAANTGVGPSVADPRSDCVTNVIGTFNYLEAARQNQVKRFVFASSGAPVGECEPPIHEDMAPHPVSPYGASKLAGEGYCSAYYRTFGIETVALRFGNVYGPGSGHKNSVVAKFIQQAMRGETLEIYGDGGQTRDFIYIDDLVRAIRLAATVDGIGGEVFQIATNAETTVSEIVNMLLPILADSGIQKVKIKHSEPRIGDVRRNFSDTSKARRLLGWQARVDLMYGLIRTVEWFAKRKSEFKSN